MKFYFNKYITSIAHRGYSGKFKGNRHRAIKKAYKKNFDMIEIDIQACKSGELILHHDLFIKNKLIKDLKLQEIKKMDKTILTFKEFITQFPYEVRGLYLDLKGGIETAFNLFTFIKTWDINIKRMIAFSFNFNHLDLLKKKIPELKRGLITDNIPNEYIMKYINENVEYVSLHYSALEKSLIKKLRQMDKIIFTYTLNNHKECEYIKNFDIDGIVSNYKIIKSSYYS
jgi:glycerophosphoryl diester phosphodiesterase